MAIGEKVARALREKEAKTQTELERKAERLLRRGGLVDAAGDVIPAKAPVPPAVNGTVPERRSPGAPSFVTPEERLEIWRLHVVDGYSFSKIAELTNRTRETIGRACDDSNPEYQRFRDVIGAQRVESIKARMRVKSPNVLDKWESAMDAAVERGNHKPMYDWLKEAGAVDGEGKRDDGEHGWWAGAAPVVIEQMNVGPVIENVTILPDDLVDVREVQANPVLISPDLDPTATVHKLVRLHKSGSGGGYVFSMHLPDDVELPPGTKVTKAAEQFLRERDAKRVAALLPASSVTPATEH